MNAEKKVYQVQAPFFSVLTIEVENFVESSEDQVMIELGKVLIIFPKLMLIGFKA